MVDIESNNEIRNFLEIYLRVAAAATRIICRKFNVSHPLQAWREGNIKRVVRLNRRVYLYFHGVGCTVRFRQMRFKNCSFHSVDIDYDNNCIILDPYKIINFIELNFNIIISYVEILNEIKLSKNYFIEETLLGQRYVVSWQR